MRSGARGLAAGALALAALALGAGTAQAQSGPVLEDGKTKAVYDYKQAVRQRVFIPQPGIDQDRNGQDDWVTADIIRPKEAGPANKMPAIIDPSPYYTTLCRGNEGECMADWDNDGVNDRWPLFYDNYFVPRGYAYVLGQMNGTAYTENGCPMHGGPGDIAGEKSIIDWLNGRVAGYSAASLTAPQVVADWHNGSSAMIGKSYDGTLSNGVAATGVEGLKTIVPVSAISAWYNYSRTGGVRQNTNYPAYLNGAITTAGGNDNPPGINLPDRHPICDPINEAISDDSPANDDAGDGDRHGDVNTFWRDRDYVKDAANVKAAVFATHGLQDDNVTTDQIGMWWDALTANNVPRKLWLLRAGHEDPFDSRRAVWVDTLHRWFDHWLYGVDNGIMNEPKVTIEDAKDTWGDYGDWPVPGTQNVDLFLRGAADPAAAGTLGGRPGGGEQDTLTFTAANSRESTLMRDPTGSQATKRVFITRPLAKDVRLSQTGHADLVATLGDATTPACENAAIPFTCANLSVTVVDYGAGTQVSRSSEGITNLNTRSCWGATGPDLNGQSETCSGIGDACVEVADEIDDACYRDTTKPTQNVTQFRVTRGVLDTSNRESLWFADASPLAAGQTYHFRFPLIPTDYTFKAGHQIAIIVGGTNTDMVSSGGSANNVPVTLDTRQSKVILPLRGGYGAAVSSGITDRETTPPALSGVPADITTHTADLNGAVVNYTPPTATDDEDPNPTVTCDPASGSRFHIGQTVVTCTATDANGNTSTATFNVLVGGDSTVGGEVPATLSLELGPPATFGTFVPGVEDTYEASTTATVISTAGDALLSVADPSADHPGHLVNGAFWLPEPLQARARNADNTGTAYNNVGSLLNLLQYEAPISNDAVSLQFSQKINANDALRTGTYSKALTFTLSTTNP